MRLAQLVIGTGENNAGQHGVQAKTATGRSLSRTDARAPSLQKVNAGRCSLQRRPDETWPRFGERLITLGKSILSMIPHVKRGPVNLLVYI